MEIATSQRGECFFSGATSTSLSGLIKPLLIQSQPIFVLKGRRAQICAVTRCCDVHLNEKKNRRLDRNRRDRDVRREICIEYERMGKSKSMQKFPPKKFVSTPRSSETIQMT